MRDAPTATCRGPAETLRLADIVIERLPLGRHRANAYVVRTVGQPQAVIIDPGAEQDVLFNHLTQSQLRVEAILLTHGHWDHVGAASALASASGARVYVHSADRALLKAAPIYAFRIDGTQILVPRDVHMLPDRERLEVGALVVGLRHAPGHTAGSMIFRVGEAVFTGDTMLPDAAGRVDLLGGDAAALRASLQSLGQELGPNDVICPGHGAFWPAADAVRWLAEREAAGE